MTQNKTKKMPVHILADIYWLPTHNPERSENFPPNGFRTLSFFTSDFSTGWTVHINYSKDSLQGQANCYRVRLFFYFLDEKRDELKRLTKNAEVLIMDGFKVIAVCRNLRIPKADIYMDSLWTNDE